MRINHSFQNNSLLKMTPPPTLLGELFCEGKYLKRSHDRQNGG